MYKFTTKGVRGNQKTCVMDRKLVSIILCFFVPFSLDDSSLFRQVSLSVVLTTAF